MNLVHPPKPLVRAAWPAAVVPAIAALVLAIVGCGGDDGERGKSVRTSDPVRTFSPVVRLDARERYMPISAVKLLESSILRWSSASCGDETIAIGRRTNVEARGTAPQLKMRRLAGADAYSHRPLDGDCERRVPTAYRAIDRTRPFDSGRPAGLAPGDGFHLDIGPGRLAGDAREAQRGRLTIVADAQTFFEHRRISIDGQSAQRISYWFLFGYTDGPAGGRVADGPRHEGGWERLDVLLLDGDDPREYVPHAVRFYAYGRVREVPWSKVGHIGETTLGRDLKPRRRAATHPLAYSALGSHALYPRPGRYRTRLGADHGGVEISETVEVCSECKQWETWECLDKLEKQLWYGFGGGWGRGAASDWSSGPSGPRPPA